MNTLVEVHTSALAVADVAQAAAEPPVPPIMRIHAGEVAVQAVRSSLQTTLGSCVSVCVLDERTRIGGMNHFMLPVRALAEAASPVNAAARYGAHAMELLINQMLRLGASRSRFTARIIGGASMLSGLGGIGQANIQFAREFLARERIAVVMEDVGGASARRLSFDLPSGLTRVQRLRGYMRSSVELKEHQLALRLDDLFNEDAAADGRAILFDS